ncbi:substrate-binding domain-containing protein [Paraburkholderia sp. CNPSo 3157]|uniref:Substrate-binding domain-containing protein n=1 Tax=Paraburkholderia franconis TaxID=2654983 RepID=A0A7X1NE23_9BURK|nr:substrate-binding domain-containing protein [Paraburkholderia franconis]MPW20185.1 substrate-binding domain-containing protein [Paraburkholderia franconis]
MPHQQRRRFIVASALAAIGTVVPKPSKAANSNGTIALALKSIADPFTSSMIDAARAFQKHSPYPFELVVQGTATETDVDGQIRMVENLIAQRVSAIVLAPIHSKALIPVVNESIRRGIITLTIDNPLDPEASNADGMRIPFVGPDNLRGAKLIGNYLAQKLHGGDHVGIVEGVPSDRNAQQRTTGFMDEMKAAHVEIVAVEAGDWEYAKGKRAAAAILARKPEIRALLCGNDNMAMGAVDAVRDARKTGSVLITGYNNSNAIKPLLRNGSVLATVDQFAAKQAVYGIDVALQALLQQRRQEDLSAYIETPVALVTRGNA